MELCKIQCIGNDFLFVSCLDKHLDNPDEIAVLVCDRHFGIGADGFVLISYSQHADFKIESFDSDGISEVCSSNILRCAAHYVNENNFCDKKIISFETYTGVKYVSCMEKDGEFLYTVNVGKALFTPQLIPVDSSDEFFIDKIISLEDKEYIVSSVLVNSKINTVLYTENGEELNNIDMSKFAPYIEKHNIFPQGTNVEYVNIVSKSLIQVRCWESNKGEAIGCDYGAAAAFAVSLKKREVDTKIIAELYGGDLSINIDDEGFIFTSGCAKTVFSVEWQ